MVVSGAFTGVAGTSMAGAAGGCGSSGLTAVLVSGAGGAAVAFASASGFSGFSGLSDLGDSDFASVASGFGFDSAGAVLDWRVGDDVGLVALALGLPGDEVETLPVAIGVRVTCAGRTKIP